MAANSKIKRGTLAAYIIGESKQDHKIQKKILEFLDYKHILDGHYI